MHLMAGLTWLQFWMLFQAQTNCLSSMLPSIFKEVILYQIFLALPVHPIWQITPVGRSLKQSLHGSDKVIYHVYSSVLQPTCFGISLFCQLGSSAPSALQLPAQQFWNGAFQDKESLRLQEIQYPSSKPVATTTKQVDLVGIQVLLTFQVTNKVTDCFSHMQQEDSFQYMNTIKSKPPNLVFPLDLIFFFFCYVLGSHSILSCHR